MKRIFTLLSCLAAGVLHAQIYFENTYGGNSQDVGRSAIETFDKQFVAVGSTSSYGNGSTDVWLIKTWPTGFLRWSHTFGGLGVDWGYSVKETKADSGLIIAGYTDSYGAGGYDCYLIKTDSLGATQWTKTYGGSNWDFAYCVAPTKDGGYILAGGTYSFGAGDEDVYLIKTNSNGDTLWTKTLGGKHQDEARCVRQTRDGGYIICGTTKSFRDSVNGDAWVIRTNSIGDTLWTKSIGGSYTDDAHDIIECQDSTFYLIGGSNSWDSVNRGANMDVYLARLSSQGKLQWTNHIGGSDYDRGEAILEVFPNCFSLLGSTKSYGFGNGSLDMLTYFVDAGGYYFGGGHTFGDPHKASDEEGFSLFPTDDHGYLLCGYSTGFSTNGIPDFFLVKTDSIPQDVPIIAGIISLTEKKPSALAIFPNPAETETIVRFNEELTSRHIYIHLKDLTGREIDGSINTEQVNTRDHTEVRIQFDRKQIPPGLYFIEIIDGDNRSAGKIILR